MAPGLLGLVIITLVIYVVNSKKDTCDAGDTECQIKTLAIPYGTCESHSNGECKGTIHCKRLSNSALKVCMDPIIMDRWNKTDFSFKMLRHGTFNGGIDSLCLKSINSVYDAPCKRLSGQCQQKTMKCIIDEAVQQDIIKMLIEDNLSQQPYDADNDDDKEEEIVINLLIAIDGLFGRDIFQLNWRNIDGSQPDLGAVRRDDIANWKSHVANFYDSYKGYKYYWYGPNSFYVEITKKEMNGLIDGIINEICQFIGDNNLSLDMINIDFVGYDKAGYIIMEIVKKLKINGCHINKIDIKPIIARFIGLYDPVLSHIDSLSDWYDRSDDTLEIEGDDDDDKLEINNNIIVVYGDKELYKRELFNIYEIDTENKQYFAATHGAMGCSPDGCTEFYWMAKNAKALNDSIHHDYNAEIKGCIEADKYIREKAKDAGLPINATTDQYYVLFQSVTL